MPDRHLDCHHDSPSGQLERLDLSDNDLGDESLRSLSRAFDAAATIGSGLGQLRYLLCGNNVRGDENELGSNHIGDAGATALADSLAAGGAPGLRELTL